MGFLSGISKAIGSVVGAIADPISSVLDIGSGIMGIASPFMEQSSTAAANAQNLQIAREQMAFQREQNQKAMAFSQGQDTKAYKRNWLMQGRAQDFSERMASTQYQRVVKDMIAAGINPMLAVSQGGAAAPVGAMGSAPSSSGVTSSGASAVMQPTFRAASTASAAQAMQLVQQARQTKAMIENVNADTAVKKAEALRTAADTNLKRNQTITESFKPRQNQQFMSESIARERKILDTLMDTIENIRADTAQKGASAQQIHSQNVLMKTLQDNDATNWWAPYILDMMRSGR